MKQIRQAITAIIVILLFSGCSKVNRKSIVSSESEFPKDKNFVPYSLPEARIAVTIIPNKSDGKLIVTTETKMIPSTKLYYATVSHNIFNNDEFKLETENGLLKTANFQSEDQAAEFVKNATEFATNIAKATAAPGADSASFQSRLMNYEPREYLLNPHNFESNSIEDDFFSFQITDDESSTSTTPISTALNENDVEPATGKDGIVFHPYKSITLTIMSKEIEIETETETETLKEIVLAQRPLVIPDTTKTVTLPLYAGAFVKTEYSIGFQDGMLNKFEAKKPSEAVGLIKIPLGISKAILSAPGEILKLKIDYTNSQKDLITAQKDLIQAQKDLNAALAPPQQE